MTIHDLDLVEVERIIRSHNIWSFKISAHLKVNKFEKCFLNLCFF
jgi:hypothetical protein